ncbi:MAG TPA: CoA transferase [Acetobacteraceae bacterium]|nr:CoA transferase [Acetobacteraceae bacterium]
MALLGGFHVVQVGGGLAAAVCGRLLADLGADVGCIEPDSSTQLVDFLNHGKPVAECSALAVADLIVCEGSPGDLRARGWGPDALRRLNATVALVFISPFGLTGPKADQPASDLTLMYSSGIARLLTGQVDDLAEAPVRPVGEQSAFIGGLAAACAGMHASQPHMSGAVIDVSIEEALATMAMAELAGAGLHGRSRSRRRVGDGNGATVCILPARDGYAAISPREDRQWAAWLVAMGSPDWGGDPRFASKADRVANWEALHALMSAWSRQHDKQWIADTAQAARVPSFPLRELPEQLHSPQLAHRRFWRAVSIGGRTVQAPSAPFGLSIAHAERNAPEPHGPLPLSGVRVLDFSWVIAGPTTTRYLAAMGADVIKVEAPGKGDPGRASDLHTVLGQGKRAIVLDLKRPEAVEAARALAERCDVLVENFATGVMDRFGLGAAALRECNPSLVYVSASGLGRTGPESHAVAYGTLLQCYAGFAGLNRHPDAAPRVGFAWLDPMCGLMLAFVVAAALWQRRTQGGVARVDFSMIEAMLWTLAEPLLAAQTGESPTPPGDRSSRHALHGAFRCAGEDAWVAAAVVAEADRQRVSDLLAPERLRGEDAASVAERLVRTGIPAAALASSLDLVRSEHLRARQFWEPHGGGVLPGLPWRASFGRASGPAPAHGADTAAVLRDRLGMGAREIAALLQTGEA